jgi:hypothetical protein
MKASKAAVKKTDRGRVRKLPVTPVISRFTKVPSNLPLDFYNCKWLLAQPIGLQRTIPNHSNVAFLPDPTLSLFPENHPNFGIDKKLSSLAFNKKKLDTVLVQYKIKEILQEEEEPEDGDNNGEDVVEDEIIDLEREESGQYFADGKWGNQYDDKDEDEDFEPEENNNENYKEFDEEEMGG